MCSLLTFTRLSPSDDAGLVMFELNNTVWYHTLAAEAAPHRCIFLHKFEIFPNCSNLSQKASQLPGGGNITTAGIFLRVSLKITQK